MSKKKTIHADDITDSQILNIYKNSLALLYQSNKKLAPEEQLFKLLKRFIHYETYSFLMQNSDEQNSSITAITQKMWNEKTKIESVHPSRTRNKEASFAEVMNDSFHGWLMKCKENRPKKNRYDYVRIISRDDPKIVIWLASFFTDKKDESFTQKEKKIINKLSTHIVALLRIIISFNFLAGSQQYLNRYLKICENLVLKYSLTEMEYKIVIDLLFGRANEEIAGRNFISVFAIKKHLKHIFKKTNTKNRVDFLSCFFTSPEHLYD